jgi:hypothetical protein
MSPKFRSTFSPFGTGIQTQNTGSNFSPFGSALGPNNFGLQPLNNTSNLGFQINNFLKPGFNDDILSLRFINRNFDGTKNNQNHPEWGMK